MDEGKAQTAAEVLAALQAGRAAWEAALAAVPAARMTEPGVQDTWSVKDLVAHVAWCEQEMVPVFRDHVLAGSDLWNLPLDEQNAVIYAANRDRPLAEVLAADRDAYAGLLVAAQALTDADLTDPGRYAGMPADWVPRDLLAGNSYTHYPEHIAAIRAWLGGVSGQ